MQGGSMELIYALVYLITTVGATMLVIDISLYFLYSKRLLAKLVAALFLVPTAALAFSAFNQLVN
jgi:hypothetical protein